MKPIKKIFLALLIISPFYSYPDTIKVPQHFSTIQEAINNAQNGDTILVADGIYNEEINFNGYVADSVLIKSEQGPDNCIIDCQNGSYSAGFLFNSTDCKSIIDGFTIRNATWGIWAYAGSTPTIKNNIIEYCEVGISASSESAPVINSNLIKNCGGLEEGSGCGINLSWSSAIVINNIIVSNCSASGGIYCYHCSPLIVNNTVVENYYFETGIGGGIYLDYSSPDIINNIIAFSKGPGIISIGDESNPNIQYNDFYGNVEGNYLAGENEGSAVEVDLSGMDGNIADDPLFYGDEYSLSFGSSCIDAGTPDTTGLGIGETDFLGYARLFDGDNNGTAVIDMGAIELQIGPSDYTENVSICQGEEYGGHTETGVFQRTLASATGGDSIVTTYLTVNQTYNIEEDVTICEGEDYFGYSTAGTYTREFKTINNCDSIIVTNLTIRPIGECYLKLKVPSEYATIQAAMDAALPGDTVLVADGTYTGEGNLYLDFHGKAITVKSENGPDNCIIDCVDGTGVQAFLIKNGETRGSIVEGFSIINGCWVIWIENSSPTIKNNILESNNRGIHCDGYLSNPLIENNTISKSNDEGIYFEKSKGIIQNNVIKRAVSPSSYGDVSMSCIYCNMASPTIKNNDIEWGYHGVYCRNGSNPLIESNTVKNSLSYGIYCDGSSPRIVKNQIIENTNTGVYCENSSPQIAQNLIRKNGGFIFYGISDNHQRPYEYYYTGNQPGGISINDNSNPNIQNNIIAENKGAKAGAVLCDNSSAPVIANNHIINNSSIYGGSVNIKSSPAQFVNNIVSCANNTNSNLGLCRWYKDSLFAKYIYDGAVLKNVTYYFGFINYGPPGEVQITGCTGLNETVWAETGERFWVEAPSGVFSGWYGGLYAEVSMGSNSFHIESKRTYNFVDYGCMTILSPVITSYGIEPEGYTEIGIVVDNQDNIPEIFNNNIYGNLGGNYVFSDSVDTKSAQVFDLTGTNGNISSDPLLDDETYKLKEGSPCIDAGLADLTGYDVGSVDYYGNTRITDGDGDGNSIIDIGAYESESSTIQTEEYKSICQGEEYEGHTESGEFQRTLTSATGIDSIVTTYLTVNPTYESEEFVSICEGEEYLGLTEAGDHQRNFETVNDCDSIIITHLTVNATFSSEESVSICEGDNYLGLTEEGDHERAFESVYGCDSIVTTHLSFYPPFKPTFQIDEDTLTSLQVYSGYQWFDENGSIEGATGREYTIDKSGDYYLKAQNENGCFYNSDTIFVRYSYTWDISQDGFMYSVMPNPNDGNFSFRIDLNPPAQLTLKLLNTLGQEIETRQLDYPEINKTEQFNVSYLSKGIYHLVIYSDNFKDDRKIIVN